MPTEGTLIEFIDKMQSGARQIIATFIAVPLSTTFDFGQWEQKRENIVRGPIQFTVFHVQTLFLVLIQEEQPVIRDDVGQLSLLNGNTVG